MTARTFAIVVQPSGELGGVEQARKRIDWMPIDGEPRLRAWGLPESLENRLAAPGAALPEQAWRSRANILKRYFVHVAGFNPGLVMRQMLGAGTRAGSRA